MNGWVVALLVLAACGDSRGPTRSPTAPKPGPCSSSRNGTLDYTMSYDDSERLTGIDCNLNDAASRRVWTYSYDGDALLSIAHDSTFFKERLEFGANTVSGFSRYHDLRGQRSDLLYETTLRFEPELRLTRHPFETQAELIPDAWDAVLSSHHTVTFGSDPPVTTSATYSYNGQPHVGTRTQRRSSDGRELSFMYDDQGRLIRSSYESPDDDFANPGVLEGPKAIGWGYDGDLLIRVALPLSAAIVYEHDEYGNVLRRIDISEDNEEFTTTYDYGCWE